MKPGLKHRLVREVALEERLPIEQVMQIVESQFSFTSNVISSPGYDGVKLMYLGKFKVKPWRVKKLSEKKAEQRKNKNVITHGTIQTSR